MPNSKQKPKAPVKTPEVPAVHKNWYDLLEAIAALAVPDLFNALKSKHKPPSS